MTYLRPTALREEAGETLVEVLIAMLVMGIVFIAIIAGLGTSIAVSSFHKKQATSQTVARDFGEYMQYTASYNNCGNASAYATDVSNFTNSYQLPDGTYPLAGATPSYSVKIKDVAYWDGSTNPARFVSTCTTDLGAQRFSLSVTTSTDSRISGNVVEELQVVKRKS